MACCAGTLILAQHSSAAAQQSRHSCAAEGCANDDSTGDSGSLAFARTCTREEKNIASYAKWHYVVVSSLTMCTVYTISYEAYDTTYSTVPVFDSGLCCCAVCTIYGGGQWDFLLPGSERKLKKGGFFPLSI